MDGKTVNYQEIIENNLQILKLVTHKYQGRVCVLSDLEESIAKELVSRFSCVKGEYLPAGVYSPIAPGVIKNENGTYSVHVVNPIKVVV